jgi:hypothetical protein
MVQFVVVLLVLAVAVALALRTVRRHRTGPAADPKTIRWTAFGFVACTTVVIGLFILGETFSDPGGWRAVGLTALWLLPLLGLGAAAWLWPNQTAPVLIAATGLVVAVNIWSVVASHWQRDVENAHGPMRATAIFALGAVLGVLGLHRPRLAGILLLIISIAPADLVTLSGQRAGSSSLTLLAMPSGVAGALFLCAASREHQGAPLPPATIPDSSGPT